MEAIWRGFCPVLKNQWLILSTQPLVMDIRYSYEVSLQLFCGAPNLQWRTIIALCNYKSKETLGLMHSGTLLLAVHCACRFAIHDISVCNLQHSQCAAVVIAVKT